MARLTLELEDIKLIKSIIKKAEFIWSDEGDYRCCLYADKQTSETEIAIALACGLSFAGIKKLTLGAIKGYYVDDECLHITIEKDVFEELASDLDISRVDE